MRRHLSPEEVAEQRRRARERREAARNAGAPAAPRPGEGRPAAPRPGPASASPTGGDPDRVYGRFDPGPGGTGVPRETPAGDPRGARGPVPGGAPQDPRAPLAPGAPETSGSPRASGAQRAAGARRPRGEGGRRYQPTQRPERFDDEYRTARPRRASRDAPPSNPVVARPPRRAAKRPKRTRRRVPILGILAFLVVLIISAGVVTTLWADSKLQHVDALSSYPGQPGQTPGTVTLIVGTDSRAGLTEDQQAQLSTGSEQDAGGDRTDTMMLVYKPKDGGKAMIISIPRDLLVNIPDYGEYKINAAYSLGGPKLLAQTLETKTGIRIDHYAEIGFGGFAGIVDALGGIDMCIDEPIEDPDAGINLGAGCQKLGGAQALGFVRTRHGFAQQDLQRVQNQRKFLSALMSEMAKPSTLLNPFRLTDVIKGGAAATVVDNSDHIWSLASVMWSIRSNPVTATVPFDGMADGSVGSYLVWGDTTNTFFDYMRQGKTPPPESYEMPQ